MNKPLIGIIVKNRNEKFIPMVGYEIDVGDGDTIFDCVGKQPPQDTPEAAGAFLTAETTLAERYMVPVPAGVPTFMDYVRIMNMPLD